MGPTFRSQLGSEAQVSTGIQVTLSPLGFPKGPVLAWRSLAPASRPTLPCVGDLRYQARTSSGRAALYAALKQMQLAPGSPVLVPSYHCPTMVAPILQAGLIPAFYPIGPDGLPLLSAMPPTDGQHHGAMIVAHLFGITRSLSDVHEWCKSRTIRLIEDCAHSYFGWAGDRPVGQWGDYATASLTKFFPVGEAGLLASAHHTLQPLELSPAGLRTQIKGMIDVIEMSRQHGELAGITHLAAPLLNLKNGIAKTRAVNMDATHTNIEAVEPDSCSLQSMVRQCDMSRIGQRATLFAAALHRWLPSEPAVKQRQANYHALSQGLFDARGASPLFGPAPDRTAPYAMPLLIDSAARTDWVYAAMREAKLPVFRWDRLWPGTPSLADDSGTAWRRNVLQLLCHQSLSLAEIASICRQTRLILNKI